MHGEEEVVDMTGHAFSKEWSALLEPTSPWTNEGKLLLLYCRYS